MNKKAVSEIIIVVILVSVVVAIGAMVVGWMKTYIDNTKQNTQTTSYEYITCGTDVSFKVWTREGNSMVCLNSTTQQIYVYIDNEGIPIDYFYVRLNGFNSEGFANSTTEIINASLDKMDIKLFKINYSYVPNFSDVILMPVLIDPTNQQRRMCKNTVLDLQKSQIPSCEYNYAFLQS